MIPRNCRSRSTPVFVGALTVLLLCCCSLLAQEPETPPPPPLPPPQLRANGHVAIRAGRVFDGKSDDFKRQQIILIEGTRITQVGPADKINIPIATGERFTTLWDFQMLLARGGAQMVRPDV